jgi:hypothetical protein
MIKKSYGGGGLNVGPVLDQALDTGPMPSQGCQVKSSAVVFRPVVHVGLKRKQENFIQEIIIIDLKLRD